jgi:Zn-dependent protease with chaperone function
MSFDKDAWVDDMITQVFGGAIAGVAGASLVPQPDFALAAIGGGLSGLAFGLLTEPIKSLLSRLRERRRSKDKESKR